METAFFFALAVTGVYLTLIVGLAVVLTIYSVLVYAFTALWAVWTWCVGTVRATREVEREENEGDWMAQNARV